MDTNQAAGLLLCHVIGEAMKANTSQRGLLSQLRREISSDTTGFAELFPFDQRGHIRAELNRPAPVTLGQSLKGFIKDHIRAGYLVTPDGVESPDGLHRVNLPTIGKQYAAHLVRVGI